MTLTVVLCAHNEEAHLDEQLDAILGQSRPADELVLLDDGSTDRTLAILTSVKHRRVQLLSNPCPSGPNAAYNQAVRLATSDWVYLAGAHDVVQPAAFEAFADCGRHTLSAVQNAGRAAQNGTRSVPTTCPLICGDLVEVACHWLPAAGFLTPAMLLERWQGPELRWINGNATFIRREAWCGEHPGLAWLGDWWQYHTLALRRGLVYLPQPITKWRPLPESHSLGYVDPKRMRNVALELTRLLEAAENVDIRAAFLRTGLLDIPHAGDGEVRRLLAARSPAASTARGACLLRSRHAPRAVGGGSLPDIDPVPDDCFADGNGR